MKAYKLFRTLRSRPGEIFPLYVNADKPTPIGEWIDAEEGTRLSDGKVKSRLGHLAFRPGWHLSDVPLATHIGVKDASGRIVAMNPQHRWYECEYSDGVDYQDKAHASGISNGRFNPRNAYIKEIPQGGFYRYKTNPMMFGDWIIAGSIKVIRPLSDEEVAEICEANGCRAMPRYVTNCRY